MVISSKVDYDIRHKDNRSVHSQLQANIHAESPVVMGFYLASERFLTLSAVNAQTY